MLGSLTIAHVGPSGGRYDAVVVGGRVAGALTAAGLGRRGLSVAVLEARTFPSATLSTHFFRGDGLVRRLAELDLLGPVLALGAPRLVCEYFYLGGGAEPQRQDPQEPGEAGFCLSVQRESLDAVVAEHVAALPNVHFHTGVRVDDVVRDGDAVVGVRDESGRDYLAPLTVGADGRRSVVARRVGAGLQEHHRATRLMYYGYWTGWTGPDGSAPDGPEFSLAGNEIVYVFPSDAGRACIALSIPVSRQEQAHEDGPGFFRSRLERHAGLWPRFAAAAPTGRLFCAPPEDSVVRAAAGPGWALVGDAGTHQDPWTGFGMDTAARQAEELTKAVTEHGASWADAYAAARDAVTLDRFHMTVEAAPDLSVLVS